MDFASEFHPDVYNNTVIVNNVGCVFIGTLCTCSCFLHLEKYRLRVTKTVKKALTDLGS